MAHRERKRSYTTLAVPEPVAEQFRQYRDTRGKTNAGALEALLTEDTE